VVLWTDRRSKEIFDVAEDKTDIEEFTKRVHPDDVERVWAGIEAALDPTDPKSYAIEYRLQRGDGEVRRVEAHGLTYFEGAPVERRAVGMVGTCQDITERKRAEEEHEKRERELLLMREASHRAALLEESRNRLQFALDAALLGWWQYDPIPGLVWGDTRLKEMLEIAEDWPNIEKFYRRVHPDDLERVRAAMEAAIDPTNPKPYAIEFRHVRGDGQVRWIGAHAHVHFEGSGRERRAVSMIGTGQDITERKQQEAAQARLAAIVTSSADAIVGKTLDGIVTNWNEAAERMFGYSAGEMIGQSIRRIIPADRQAEEDMILARLAQSESIEHFETKRVTKDGRTFDASVTISPVRDAEGRVIGAAKIIRDITQRKRTQARLADSEARFRAMFENAAVGIAHAAPDGRWLLVNQALCRIVGQPADELLTKTFEDITHPDDLAAEVAQIELAREGKIDSYVVDKRYPRKDDTIVWVRKTVGCVRKDDGSIDYFVSVMEDISAQKDHEEQVHLLMREVNHREKNVLSLVQAIARQTSAREPEDFVRRFTERLQALAANQDLLVRSEWHGVDVEDLARAQLAHFADLLGSRIATHGPKLRLKAGAAQALGLAMHELATNAGKYGALSTDKGRIDVGWGTDGDTFTMSWTEREGPLVSAPKRGGFGTTVVERMAKQSVEGVVKLDYAPSGLSWRLTCPAANALERA
jgi:PAS domain S-box-containing protein